jgi:glycosyltransferase involved in cell wall biosynthesis
VHSSHYRAAAEAACGGPVATIPLAFAATDLPPPRPVGDRLVVTTVGHVNRNKRADEILHAIGASARLRDRVLYVIVGHVEEPERQRLLALARRVGARPPHITGWVPDEVLHMVMAGTDVVCCLRYPALEGGSGSLILALLSARPTLVSNHASYADVPDGLVLKCPPGDEAAAVQHHLEAILDDPASARVMGERARKYAQLQHSPSAYVDSLLPALDAATRAQPAVRTALGIGRHLARLGVAPGDPAIERLDAARAALLGEPPGGVLTDKIKTRNSAYA